MLAARSDDTSWWQYDTEIESLMPRLRGWTPDEVAVMLLRVTEYNKGYLFAQALPLVLNAADQLGGDGRRAVMPWLRHAHTRLMDTTVEARLRASLTQRLRALLASVDEAHIPEGLIPVDAPWASPLSNCAKTSPTSELAAFVRHLVSLSEPRPTQRWRATCLELAHAASARDVLADVLRALAEGDPLCSSGNGAHTRWVGDGCHYHYVVRQNDGDLARGVVWAAALTHGPAAVRHLGALALRTGGPATGVIQDLKLAGCGDQRAGRDRRSGLSGGPVAAAVPHQAPGSAQAARHRAGDGGREAGRHGGAARRAQRAGPRPGVGRFAGTGVGRTSGTGGDRGGSDRAPRPPRASRPSPRP
jgi:hypothetical protein